MVLLTDVNPDHFVYVDISSAGFSLPVIRDLVDYT